MSRHFLFALTLSTSFSSALAQQDSLSTSGISAAQDTIVSVADRKNTTPFDFIFGDSIARGMQMSGNIPGDAVEGRSPSQILLAIGKFPRDSLKGKNILLTVGAGNAPKEVDQFVPLQMDYLIEAGVGKVTVMGVSERRRDIDGKSMNVKIKKITKDHGFIYGGPVSNTGPDRIHPKNMDGYAALVNQAEMKLVATFPAIKMSIRRR
jgi:hypothetical protein